MNPMSGSKGPLILNVSKLSLIKETIWVYHLGLMVENLVKSKDSDVLENYSIFAKLWNYTHVETNGNESYLNSLPELDAVSADFWFDIWQPFPSRH